MPEVAVSRGEIGNPEGTPRRQTFVYAICGDRHVERVNLSLRFLKKFSRSDILVIASRTSSRIDHDQVIQVPAEERLNDHQMGLMLKTSVHRRIAGRTLLGCYLDTDVIAVSKEVDSIFAIGKRPFAFAADHTDLRSFSSWGVACGCKGARCHHLIEAIRGAFHVEVNPKWQHWNGGVFVFSEDATPFLDCWNEFTRQTLDDAAWQTRDQGTLIAAAWKLKLQNTPRLDRRFNLIVDCYRDVPRTERVTANNSDLVYDDSYSLRKHKSKPSPILLHFINGGVMKRGWKNWDEAEKKLGKDPSQQSFAIHQSKTQDRALSDENRVVNGLWIGNHLSSLELLTIHSFLRHGHEFHLWLYDDVTTPLPKGVILENAEEILPRSRIFRQRDIDPETGVGRLSLGPFSDLFRYKLLYEKGGWWVDMDVTCLRPLNFQTGYVFRPHRVGVVANIAKCPPRSALMKMTYEQAERETNENTSWLLPNRILSANVARLKLDRFAYPDICNQESWRDAIQPLICSDQPLPPHWYAIHWANEMWRTLKASGGIYKGRPYMDAVPEKDNPPEEGTLRSLYREYGLPALPIAATPDSACALPPPTEGAPILKHAVRQPVCIEPADDLHINILLPSLAVGGAERTVLETLQGLAGRAPTAKILLFREIEPHYELKKIGRAKVSFLDRHDVSDKLRRVALEVLASPSPVVFTHLVSARYLRVLWDLGVSTVPVVHNSQPSWQDQPQAFDHPRVPYVVAVSENVAQQMQAAGCPKPIVTIRHESQRWYSLDELKSHRKEMRARYNIPDHVLLIGMVGEFKSQKAYTRAVRVLAEMKRFQPCKLIILGGWDHEWGNGRAAYTATCRQALDLGVMADLLTPGSVPDVEKHYAAFDIFLNTSVYEGLSIATLEAARAGCPIVSADAGGNRESLPEEAILVADSSDIGAYVAGIKQSLVRDSRIVPVRPPDPDLVPRLWSLLGQYGCGGKTEVESSLHRPLFVTDNLNLGGAGRSLVNLLCRLPGSCKPWLGVLNETNHPAFLEELEAAGIPIFSFQSASSYLDRTERILNMRRRLNANTIVFWNTDARVKLMLAKILPASQVRLIDVSPGPWLFEDMDRNIDLQRRIAFNAPSYFDRLDHFVAKYAGGTPQPLSMPPNKVSVIPNGVPNLAKSTHATVELPANLPPNLDPSLVIGTCCRILPSKRIEYFVDMMAEMNRRMPGVTMVLVGAANRRYEKYQKDILARMRSAGVSNIIFAGQQANVIPYLRAFRVFVMLGTDHGCPNASLEAMSLGLPIVTARHGGATEQVEDRVNGFLVSEDKPTEMAHRVRMLLTNPAMLRSFGEASSRIARERFSMELMVKRYTQLLNPNALVATAASRTTQPITVPATHTVYEGEQPCIN
jgi:glycosyltransferase involved in cell wall biosynthesis